MIINIGKTSLNLFYIAIFTIISIAYGYYNYEEDNIDKSKTSFRLDLIERGPCTIPIVTEEITQEEFLEKYAYTSAVIFKRTVQQREKNAEFQQKCELENLSNEFGDKTVTISTANTYSYKKYSMRFKDYLEDYVFGFEKSSHSPNKLKYGNETWYFFGENNYTEWKSLLDLYDRPKYELPNHDFAYSFGVAGYYTGVNRINTLIY